MLTSHLEYDFTLFYLYHFLLPQRVRQIRDLYIKLDVPVFWFSPSPKGLWFEFWRILGQMTGLRSLRIDMTAPYPDIFYSERWLEHEVQMFQPVKNITAPNSFVVVMPDRVCSTNLEVGNSRCIFQVPVT